MSPILLEIYSVPRLRYRPNNGQMQISMATALSYPSCACSTIISSGSADWPSAHHCHSGTPTASSTVACKRTSSAAQVRLPFLWSVLQGNGPRLAVVQDQGDPRRGRSKLLSAFRLTKFHLIESSSMSYVSAIKLIRTVIGRSPASSNAAALIFRVSVLFFLKGSPTSIFI